MGGGASKSSSSVYTPEEVATGFNRQLSTQKRLQLQSPQLAVLHGTNWTFNPEPPLDPTLVAKLGQHFPPELPYTAAIRKVIDAIIDVHVGWDKVGRGGQAQRDERWGLQQRAVEDALEQLNTQLEGRKVRLVAEAGAAQKSLVDLKIKVKTVNGRAWSQQQTKHSVTKETSIYLVFNEGEDAETPVVVTAVLQDAAPPPGPGAKIKELKELLDAGAISQEEFDASKAKLLEQMIG